MRIWLLLVAALVFCMIVVGGAVRLTDSGLSITEWQPLLGAIPPLNDADWLAAFEKYKAIPEYAIVNTGMSLDAFKAIYWWEWAHRFLGRFIGVAFALPFVAFWLMGKLRGRFALKCLGVFALGGLQGAIGWYMVKSGLVDRIDVSQYRLALHLLTAFALLSLLVWLALEAGPADRARAPAHRDARPAARGDRAVPARLRAVGPRRARRRTEGGADLQHLAADGRQARARRARHAVTLVSQLLRERDDGAVRPPRYRLRRRHPGALRTSSR